MTVGRARIFSALVLLISLGACDRPPRDPPSAPQAASAVVALPGATIVETANFRISSTASDEQTARVGKAVQALHAAYQDHFHAKHHSGKFELVLYRDQAEFKAYNTSTPWAEAYYRKPRAYAYFSDGANPYHWMLHEVTHQLLAELSGYRLAKWANEGVASYFNTSRLERGALKLGVIDPDTYPIWWLSSLELTGDLERDIKAGRIIPLRKLLTGTGPDINRHVNTYYIHYWSLTHFLFHYRDGKYANAYRELLTLGGSLEDFERLIGPTETIQAEWYVYLQRYAGTEDTK